MENRNKTCTDDATYSFNPIKVNCKVGKKVRCFAEASKKKKETGLAATS